MPLTLIAEFGSSPAPEWDFTEWIDLAQWSGADAVKVQLFRADHFPAEEQASKRRLEFPRARWDEFVKTAHKFYLQAGASVFDNEAVRMVAERGDFIKVAAREAYNGDLLTYIAGYNPKRLPVYRSIGEARVLRCGPPYDLGDVILLTIPRYPAPLLPALATVYRASREFGKMRRRWGWSSHTRDWLDCWLAKKFGAVVIEKHFALNRTDLEAGHSLLPEQFRRLKERIT